MRVEHSEPSRIHPDDEIRLGRSSWDDEDLSIKYAWLDKRGHVSRGGEVPVAALPQMLEFAIRNGYLSLSPDAA